MEVGLTTNLNKRDQLRKKRQEEKRRRTTTLILVAVGVIVLISMVAIIPNLLRSRSEDAEGRGFTLGNPEAPISVTNFSNYACVFCERFAATQEPDFIANFVETGDVYYRYVNLPSSENEDLQNAAKASYCADEQDGFFDYKSFLYSAVGVQDGLTADNLVEMATTAGLDRASFEACLQSSTYANAITEDHRFAQAVGIPGTPWFLVNGQLVSADELVPLVESLLDR
jgi:protein-disulfide isomerase